MKIFKFAHVNFNRLWVSEFYKHFLFIVCFFLSADMSSSVDWTLRHSRGVALGIALKESMDKIWCEKYQKSVRKTVTSLTDADRVRVYIFTLILKYMNVSI